MGSTLRSLTALLRMDTRQYEEAAKRAQKVNADLKRSSEGGGMPFGISQQGLWIGDKMLKTHAAFKTVAAGLELATAGVAAANGDWEKLNETMKSLPAGMGEVYSAFQGLFAVIDGSAKKTEEFNRKLKESIDFHNELKAAQGLGRQMEQERTLLGKGGLEKEKQALKNELDNRLAAIDAMSKLSNSQRANFKAQAQETFDAKTADAEKRAAESATVERMKADEAMQAVMGRGFDSELRLLRSKHDRELIELNLSGKDRQALLTTQQSEEVALVMKNEQKKVDLVQGLQDRIDLASGKTTARDIARRELMKQLADMGVRGSAALSIAGMMGRADSAEFANTIDPLAGFQEWARNVAGTGLSDERKRMAVQGRYDSLTGKAETGRFVDTASLWRDIQSNINKTDYTKLTAEEMKALNEIMRKIDIQGLQVRGAA